MPGSGPGQSDCSSSASPSGPPSLCTSSHSLLERLLLLLISSISIFSMLLSPSSPRLAVLLLPLQNMSIDSTLFSLADLFLLPNRIPPAPFLLPVLVV